ncbi:Mesencephalic astrocyte-derived neurotrophic factor-like protein, partial [Fragariocoptes setiger]
MSITSLWVTSGLRPTLIVLAVLLAINFCNGLDENDCPVCFSIVNKLIKSVPEGEKPTQDGIIQNFLDFCKTAEGSEQRFCYFMGGQDVSATRTYNDMASRIVMGMPVDKICDHLQKRDTQICELRYKKKTDLKTLNVKTLKVGDLKRILREYDVKCEGCIEKSEFLSKVQELQKSQLEQNAEL